MGPVSWVDSFLGRRRLERGLESFDGSVVHLTHTDLDAVASNAIHLRRYGGDDVFTVYTEVGGLSGKLRLIEGVARAEDPKVLSLSDLNFDARAEEILDACRSLGLTGWRVEWRDHHPWDREVLKRFEGAIDYLRVDRDYAGCEVVQQDLLPDDEVARRIAEIGRDRDLWINEDPLSEKLSTVIGGVEAKEEVSRKLASGTYWDEELESRYRELREKKEEAVERSLKNARIVEDGFRVGVTESEGYNSESADAIRERYSTDLEVVVSGEGTYSLRSEHGVCTAVAERHGGGGHPDASGGDLGFGLIDRLLFKLKGTRHPKVERLVETGLAELEARVER